MQVVETLQQIHFVSPYWTFVLPIIGAGLDVVTGWIQATVNGKQVKIDVRVLNSYLAGQIIVLNESSTERPNAYALTVVRCGNPTVTVENATNIYLPVVYA